MDNEPVTSSTPAEVGIENFPGDQFTTTPPQEYVVRPEHADGIARLMDTIPPESTLKPEEIENLRQFEETMIKYANKAREKGLPVGIDYFTSYKQGFLDRFIGLGGAAAFAVLVPIIAKQVKDMRVIDKATGEVMINEFGEEVKVGVMYWGNGKGSEQPKFQTMDPNVDLTPEQAKYAKMFGKLPDDPRIIDRFSAFLRKASLDEIPQAAALLWGHINLFGPRSAKRMEARASEPRLDPKDPEAPPGPSLKEMYPDAFDVYYRANRAGKSGVKKGFFNGYSAVDGLRGSSEEAQFLVNAIFQEYMSKEAETMILTHSIINIASGKGAK